MFFRPLSEGDVPFLLEIRNHKSTRKFLENKNKFTIDECKKWFFEKKPFWLIISTHTQNYVIEDVGYLRLSDDTQDSICVGCDIHQDHRNKGYAKKAYGKIIDLYKEKGYTNLWLWVFESNTIAYNLYLSLGFREIDSRYIESEKYIKMLLTL